MGRARFPPATVLLQPASFAGEMENVSEREAALASLKRDAGRGGMVRKRHAWPGSFAAAKAKGGAAKAAPPCIWNAVPGCG